MTDTTKARLRENVMTDLEMTRLAAEAMGYVPFGPGDTPDGERWLTQVAGLIYDPLHDDAQAMAMVKKLRLNVWSSGPDNPNWRVMGFWREPSGALHEPDAWNADLNRAIVECVARMMQQRK